MKRVLAAAWLFAGCGPDLHHGVDAQPADASIDTVVPSGDDVPANAVKLTITRIGAPVAGVAVVFQAADSSLVRAVLTNDKGIAWAIMESGGFVTAIESKGAGIDELTTFSAVQAADALELAFEPAGDIGQWPVVLGIPGDTGAASHQVYTSCGGPFAVDPSAGAEALLVGCKGVADVLVVSLDELNEPLHAFYAPSLAVPSPPPPDTDAMAPTYPPLVVSGLYAAPIAKSFSYSNVPAAITFVGTSNAFATTHGRIYERTAGESTSGGSAALQIALPNASAMSLVGTALFSTDIGAQLISDSGPSTAAYALDVGSALLPPFSAQPGFDVATRSVTWTERTGAVQPDLVRTRAHFYRDDIPAGRAWTWRLIAPRTSTTVTYPQLPLFGFDFNPAAGDVAGVDELTTANVPGGYAAARPTGFGDLKSLVIGTTARMVVQSLNTPEL